MKYFRQIAFSVPVIVSTFLLTAATHPKFNSHSTSSKACATSLDTCPDKGCGGGDKLLNTKKNRLVPPTAAYEVIAFDDFRHLEEERPTIWKENQARTEAEQLGEDKAVMLTGFLFGAHSGSPETCNCKLSGEANNDFHINIVEHAADLMTDSIVVEMTPKWRAKISEWTMTTLQSLPKASSGLPLVRVSGYLLFDSEHVSRSGGERMTIWEIHPITKFEFCSSGSCKPDDDVGWQDLHSGQ